MSMQAHLCLLLFLAVFVVLFERSYQLQSELSYPPGGDPSQNKYNVNFLVTRNKRQRKGKMRTVNVYDDFTCIQQCFRETDGCFAVNFKKETSPNGLHDCELLELRANFEDNDGFEDDEGFDYILVKNIAFRNCAEIKRWEGTVDGVNPIKPTVNSEIIQVYCDMTTSGGGWTVIQKRLDGSVDFYRNWAEYKKGFGDKNGEYWLGLDTIHAMTSRGEYRLRVDMEDFEGNTRYAEYDTFIVAGEEDNYRLTVGGYSGDASDSFARQHSDMEFSTQDRDNDVHPDNCAVKYGGAWWFKKCHDSNLNGVYYPNGFAHPSGRGIIWETWLGRKYSLRRVEMKIRPNDF